MKHPLGDLIIGNPKTTMNVIKNAIERETPPKICIVGDFASLKTIEYGIEADIYVIDRRIKRKKIDVALPKKMKIFRVNNPPGTITCEAWNIIKKIVDFNFQLCLIVNGEEDLLTLPIIKFITVGSFVVYGQPHVGVVLVIVTEEKKSEIDTILDMMKQ